VIVCVAGGVDSPQCDPGARDEALSIRDVITGEAHVREVPTPRYDPLVHYRGDMLHASDVVPLFQLPQQMHNTSLVIPMPVCE
jgi:hypothetical protein